MAAAAEWVTLAKLLRARGIRGEIAAANFGSPLERYRPGLPVSLFSPDGSERLEQVESAWMHNGGLVLKFAGLSTRNDAEALAGWEVRIPISQRPPAPAGEFYLSDLIGCVVEEASGTVAGEVTGWEELGPQTLLRVKGVNGKQFLVPFVSQICREVDPAARRIRADLPEGLKDLEG